MGVLTSAGTLLESANEDITCSSCELLGWAAKKDNEVDVSCPRAVLSGRDEAKLVPTGVLA